MLEKNENNFVNSNHPKKQFKKSKFRTKFGLN